MGKARPVVIQEQGKGVDMIEEIKMRKMAAAVAPK
jgi:hypothetical protein